MFADDNTNYNNQFKAWLHKTPSDTEVLEGIQKDSQTWERCLHTSGGKLKLHKCKYYMMIWKFDKEGKSRLKESKNLPTMTLTSGTDPTKVKMTQFDCNQAHMTLGMMLAPNLQMQQAYTTLEKKVN